jgi:hypothetical protein
MADHSKKGHNGPAIRGRTPPFALRDVRCRAREGVAVRTVHDIDRVRSLVPGGDGIGGRPTSLSVRLGRNGDDGTVLNRFLMRAAIGFIHLRAAVRRIELAIANPPRRGERVQIYSQTTEVHRVIDLAQLVSRLTGAELDLVDSPRKEASENDRAVENGRLLGLGLRPTTLQDDLRRDVTEIATRYLDRVDRTRIPCTSRWTRGARDAQVVSR